MLYQQQQTEAVEVEKEQPFGPFGVAGVGELVPRAAMSGDTREIEMA